MPKDFTATFSDGEYAHKYYSGRRMWGVFNELAPSQGLPSEYGNLKLDKPYPFAVPVDSPVTVADGKLSSTWEVGASHNV
jgi:dipeptidase